MLALIAAALLVFAAVQLLRLLLADSDLTLQWSEKFGRSVESLRGQVVWITGASSGIGEALAYRLARAGCKLILSARRTDELERVKKQCLLSGPLSDEDVLVLTLDMVQFDTHAAGVEKAINKFQKIDVLVNNAGVSQRALWTEIALGVDRQMFEVNVLGVVSLTRCVLPHMIAQQAGHIVVVSSVAGKLGAPMSGSYTGCKHALHGWFEALRVEIFEKKIQVTMVCPGPVFSNFLEHAFTGIPGEKFHGKMDSKEKRMPTSRCAQLMAVAIANQLDEVWISQNPTLVAMYMAQYMPTLFRSLLKRLGVKQLMKVREGQK